MICKKISVDFHGVLNKNPEYFKAFVDYARTQGFLVYVVSGGPRVTITEFLRQHDIAYSSLWCVIDEPQINEQTQFFADGSFRVDDYLWDKAKAEFCRDEEIGLHIDDSEVYGAYFSTGYCRYDHQAQTFSINGQTFSADLAPQELFAKLLPFYKSK